METLQVPELNELTDWIKNNVLDVQNLGLSENLSKFSTTHEPHTNVTSREGIPSNAMSREEEELSVLEYIIGIDGMS